MVCWTWFSFVKYHEQYVFVQKYHAFIYVHKKYLFSHLSIPISSFLKFVIFFVKKIQLVFVSRVTVIDDNDSSNNPFSRRWIAPLKSADNSTMGYLQIKSSQVAGGQTRCRGVRWKIQEEEMSN